MKVLITGASGQVGSALLHSAPHSYEVVPRSHNDLDISDASAVAACVEQIRPELIINAAAYTAVDRAESEAALAHRVNSEGPRQIARAAAAASSRLIHLSTDFVFDGEASTPYVPSAPTNPLSVYGTTKRDGEVAVQHILPGRSVILRTAWVYGLSGGNFVKTMLRLMCERGAVRVVADQIGTPTSAASAAEAIWRLAEQPDLHGVHHWTDAGVASWYDFAVAIAEEAAQLRMVSPQVSVTPISTKEYPTPARRPRYSVLNSSSLAELFLPKVHWRRRLRGVLGEMKDG